MPCSIERRALVQGALGLSAWALVPGPLRATSDPSISARALGESELLLISDGYMDLPVSFVLPDSITGKDRQVAVQALGGGDTARQPCTLTLWRSGERTVLFDVGGGTHFMPTLGQLYDNLAEAGVGPAEITDVVFTHAHPDHLWGLIDDFDELVFTEATYHMNAVEWDYWRAPDTLDKTPDARKSFVVGAQNRLPWLEERINLFKWGGEVLPGVEAIDSHGHTPGHTAFAVHQGSSSVMLAGDALLHPILSFAHSHWPSGSDQDPEQGILSRQILLDRLSLEKIPMVGFHLPERGYGRVEVVDGRYRFVADDG